MPLAVFAAIVGTGSTAPQVVLQNAVEGGEAVLPGDLLSFTVVSPAIRNRHFIKPAAEPGDLRGNFRLESKAILFDSYFRKQLAAECLITRLHISEIQIGEHIRKKR